MANIDSTASNTDRMRQHLFLKQMRNTQQHVQEEDLSMCSNVVNFRLSVCLNGLEPQDKKNIRAATTSSSSPLSSSPSPGVPAAHNAGHSTVASRAETTAAAAAGEKAAAVADSSSAAPHSDAPHSDAPTSGVAVGAKGVASAAEGVAATAAPGSAASDEGGGAAAKVGDAVSAGAKQGAACEPTDREASGVHTRVDEEEVAAEHQQVEERERGLQGGETERDSPSRQEGDAGEEERHGKEGEDGDKGVKKGNCLSEAGEEDLKNDSSITSSGRGASSADAAEERGSGSSRDLEEEAKMEHAKVSEGGEVATLKDVLLANPTDKCLVSDVDEQMLINIFFNSPVRITSIAIRSTVPPPDFEWKKKTGDEDEEEEELPEDGTVAEPKVIKFDVHTQQMAGIHVHPYERLKDVQTHNVQQECIWTAGAVDVHSNNSNLDFSTVLDETPAQVITLTPQQLKGEERLPLRGSKFQRCSSLHLFIEKNQANAMHTFLNRICLFGYVNRIYVS